MARLRGLYDEIRAENVREGLELDLPAGVADESLLEAICAAVTQLGARLGQPGQSLFGPTLDLDVRAAEQRLAAAEQLAESLESDLFRLEEELGAAAQQAAQLKAVREKRLTPQSLAEQLSRELEFGKNLDIKLDLVTRLLAARGLTFEAAVQEEELLAVVQERQAERALAAEFLANEAEIRRLEAGLLGVSP